MKGDPFSSHLHATEPTTLTARVQSELKITHARLDVFSRGHFDPDIYYKALRDDGKDGDQVAGDGVWTAANLKPRSDRKQWTGLRILRVTIEGLDAQGRRHGASADVGPWPVTE